jgi:hypothetical protein
MTISEDGESSALLDQGDPGEKRQPPTSWSRRRTVVAILLGGSLCGAGWWWSHPSAFGGVGGEFGARPDRLTSVYVDMAGVPQDGQVTISNATPRVQVFGGEAQTDVLLCDGANIGIVYGEQVEGHCYYPRGGQREDTGWEQVVLKVTPVDAGTVIVVDGLDLTYTTSWQRGTEHTGWAGTIVFPTE